jgi:hypothetical protein
MLFLTFETFFRFIFSFFPEIGNDSPLQSQSNRQVRFSRHKSVDSNIFLYFPSPSIFLSPFNCRCLYWFSRKTIPCQTAKFSQKAKPCQTQKISQAGKQSVLMLYRKLIPFQVATTIGQI